MNECSKRRGADYRHATCSGTAPFGESLLKIHARSADLHFDHTVLAELIARHWKQDRPYFASKIAERGRRASWWRHSTKGDPV